MSERMTQERLTWFRIRRREVEAMGLRVDPLVVELHNEVEGARASEAQKAATIKALADALVKYAPDGDAIGCGCCATETARQQAETMRVAALRLAGRL